MFTEPYQTTALAPYQPLVKRLTDQLETNYIQGHLHLADLDAEGPKAAVVEVISSNDQVHIDAMVAPKVIKTHDGTKVAIDVRGSKRAVSGGGVALSNPADYKFAVREALLINQWVTDGPVRMSSLDVLPIRVYARWIADGLSRRLDLNPLDARHVQIIAAYYYLCQFRSEEIDEDGASIYQHGYANILSRALGIPQQDILSVVGELPVLTDSVSFVTALQSDGTNVRLMAINLTLLYTLLNGCWFGARARFIPAVAIEYPPTFLCMLYTAYTDRSYHSSFFAKTAQAADKGSQSRELVLAMNHLCRGLIDG